MDLTILDLSENESKAYQTLVRHGSASAALTAKESGVPYGKIYQVLDRLEAKGLVSITTEPTKRFIPADPKTIIKLIENKEKQLKKLKAEAEELKSEYNYQGSDPVKIARGKKNFYKIVRDMKKSKHINYTIKYSSEYNPEFVRNTKKGIDRGVKYKTMARVSNDTKAALRKWLKHGYEIKEIENNGIAMSVRDDDVLLVLINQNIIMTIEDLAFAQVMKQLFDAYYKDAKPVTESMLN